MGELRLRLAAILKRCRSSSRARSRPGCAVAKTEQELARTRSSRSESVEGMVLPPLSPCIVEMVLVLAEQVTCLRLHRRREQFLNGSPDESRNPSSDAKCRSACTPDVPKDGNRPQVSSPRRGGVRSSCQKPLAANVVQHQIRRKPRQFRVLRLQIPQPTEIRDLRIGGTLVKDPHDPFLGKA